MSPRRSAVCRELTTGRSGIWRGDKRRLGGVEGVSPSSPPLGPCHRDAVANKSSVLEAGIAVGRTIAFGGIPAKYRGVTVGSRPLVAQRLLKAIPKVQSHLSMVSDHRKLSCNRVKVAVGSGFDG